eukprot:SAG31_NODE_884_length_11256_cov_2.889666_2_plen_189_part_00
MPGKSARIRVKVVGDLDLSTVTSNVYGTAALPGEAASEWPQLPMPTPRDRPLLSQGLVKSTSGAGITVDHTTGDWLLRPDDVDAMAIGAGILGTGGGGNAIRPALAIRHYLENVNPAAALRIRSLDRIDADATILSGGVMGAPTVGVEKLMSNKLQRAGQAMTNQIGEPIPLAHIVTSMLYVSSTFTC